MKRNILTWVLLLVLSSITFAQSDSLKNGAINKELSFKIDSMPPMHTYDTLIRYRMNATYLGSIWQDLKYTVSRPAHWQQKDYKRLVVIGVVAGGLVASDYSIKQAFQHNRNNFTTSVTNQIEPFGNAYSPYLIGGMYVAGLITGDRKLESGGLMAAKSMLISTAIYVSIKSVFRRNRPTYTDNNLDFAPPFSKDKNHTSFPSGHSNTVMTFATTIAELYGRDHPWVPWVAYSVAGLTGATRLYQNRHWSSDVLIGMALGHFVTKSVFRHHRELEHKKAMQLLNYQ